MNYLKSILIISLTILSMACGKGKDEPVQLNSSNSLPEIKVDNSMSSGGNLYLKVGADGGGLSEGFGRETRTWKANKVNIYTCTTKSITAVCEHVANCQATSDSYIQITGNNVSGIGAHCSGQAFYCDWHNAQIIDNWDCYTAPNGLKVANNMSVGGNLYLKVGINGGSLSEGFTGTQSWAGANLTANVYSCTTRYSGAACDHIADFSTGDGQGSVEITGNVSVSSNTLVVRCSENVKYTWRNSFFAKQPGNLKCSPKK